MIINESRSRNEGIDPFKWLKKINVAPHEPTPPGCYTDGWGNCYAEPTSGRSQYIYKDGYKFEYDYGKKVINMYKGNTKLYSKSLSIGDFLDNPEYWVSMMIRGE